MTNRRRLDEAGVNAHRGDVATEPSVWIEDLIRFWPSPRARKWTVNTVRRLCAHSSIAAVVAVGSAVRGERHAQDVDLVVVYRGTHPTFGPVPLDVDVRAYDSETVNEKIAAGHDLLGWALHFGVLVCEQQAYWSRLREAWKGRIPFPSATEADERAARAARLTRELRAVGDLEAAAEQYLSWLTHDARARLIRSGVYPASRPELPGQLRDVGEYATAEMLATALADRSRRDVAGM
jgi:hypothetical protein